MYHNIYFHVVLVKINFILNNFLYQINILKTINKDLRQYIQYI